MENSGKLPIFKIDMALPEQNKYKKRSNGT
jgi:hypothetical protein